MNIAIIGAAGRMGKFLTLATLENKQTNLVALLEREGSENIGKTEAGITISSDLSELKKADLVIDFTHPNATFSLLPFCIKNKIKMVIGTTGFSQEQQQAIQEASKSIAIVKASNFSIGVNLCFYLTYKAAQIMQNADVEIIEAHHKHKIDAPSGTALSFGETVALARNVNLNDVAVYERFGQIGARKEGEIGFATIRSSDIIGEHTVSFGDIGERVEITHKATSRSNFANGAVFAALWLQNKTNGLFDMQDVLDLK